MVRRLESASVLPAEGFRDLQGARKQIQDAAVGKLPEHLVLAAVTAAVRCAGEGRALSEALPPNVAALVRETLKGLGRGPERKPDTVLKMAKSIGQWRRQPGGGMASGRESTTWQGLLRGIGGRR